MKRKELNPEIEIQYLKLEVSRLRNEVIMANDLVIRTNDNCLMHIQTCERYRQDIKELKKLLRESMENEIPALSAQSLASMTYYYMYLN